VWNKCPWEIDGSRNPEVELIAGDGRTNRSNEIISCTDHLDVGKAGGRKHLLNLEVERRILILSKRPRLQTFFAFKMGKDEQREEREVLDSIFPEEITGRCPALYTVVPIGLTSP